MVAALHLALARLRYRPTRWLLISLGVAIAVLMPIISVGTAETTTQRALRHGIADLPPGDRSLIVSWSGLRLTPAELAETDATTRRRLGELTTAPVRGQLLYRRIADPTGADFFLGATDALPNAVAITEGRAPAKCTPTDCEVIAVGSGTPTLDPALGLHIVGRGVRTDPYLLTGTFDPGHDTPLLLGDGVTDVAQLKALESFSRAYGWSAALDLDRVEADVSGYLADSSRVSGQLSRYRSGLVLTAPDDVLDAAQDRAARSTRRFGLLGGAATALLLGFAVIGAISGRKDHLETLRLLRRRGAPVRQRVAVTVIAAGVPVGVGAAIGLAGGAAIDGGAATLAALPTVGLLSLGAAVLVAATLGWAAQGRHPWRAVDAVIAAGAAVGGLALARGTVTTDTLAGGDDPLLTALPILAVGCGGLLIGRIWPHASRAMLRLIPHGMLGVRLGLSSAVRRPLRPVATAAFLAAAIGIVIFADGYRSTLEHGARAQAAHAVPLDAKLAVGLTLRRPLDVAGPDAYSKLAATHPVLRASAGVKVNAVESLAAEVIGVDPAALSEIDEWEPVTGDTDPVGLGRALTRADVPLPGTAIPAGAREISFAATGDTTKVQLTMWLRDADGRDTGVTLRRTGARFVASLPAGLPDARLFAFTIVEDPDYATHHQHHLGEGGSEVENITGTVTLGPPAVPGTAPAAWSGFSTAATLPIEFRLTGTRIVVTPPRTDAPIPVATDAETAATVVNGRILLTINGTSPVEGRITRVLPQFPTVGDRFVVADVRALADALDVREPGTGGVSELWLNAADPAALASALHRAPFDQLRVDLRADRYASLATDPLATGASGLLRAGALVALLVAALSLILLVVAERRDDAAELYAWESDGLSPGQLRLSLFARAAGVVAIAAPGGIAIGVALSRLTTALVQVTAVGTRPRPPLTYAVAPIQLGLTVLIGLTLGLGVAAIIAAASLREPLPRRPEQP